MMLKNRDSGIYPSSLAVQAIFSLLISPFCQTIFPKWMVQETASKALLHYFYQTLLIHLDTNFLTESNHVGHKHDLNTFLPFKQLEFALRRTCSISSPETKERLTGSSSGSYYLLKSAYQQIPTVVKSTQRGTLLGRISPMLSGNVTASAHVKGCALTESAWCQVQELQEASGKLLCIRENDQKRNRLSAETAAARALNSLRMRGVVLPRQHRNNKTT